MSSATSPPSRLAHLDGLRFLAVTAVILYHYLCRWTPPEYSPSLYPYGSTFAGLKLAQFGWLGVQLFFIISGFVIALTLSRCATLGEFAIRRYSRLAPLYGAGACSAPAGFVHRCTRCKERAAGRGSL